MRRPGVRVIGWTFKCSYEPNMKKKFKEIIPEIHKKNGEPFGHEYVRIVLPV